jgi:purine-binding chemotaxis protein CheW
MNRRDWNESGLDLLVFELAGMRLALELTVVREVIRAVLITPLPDAPAVIEGVIDVRGELVPVYDVALRFGLRTQPLHAEQRMVLAWTGERVVALRCDTTGWIERAEPAQLADPQPVAHNGSRVIGVARLADGLAIIQDLGAFLDDAERAALADAMAAAGDRR